jgi:choline dehydrogenase-like flavoprotein
MAPNRRVFLQTLGAGMAIASLPKTLRSHNSSEKETDPTVGAIVEGRHVTQDLTLTPEFCIIGSGAAGGVCALKLAEAGFDVLVLEEGPNIPKEKGPAPSQERKMLNEREVEMYKLLYQEGATRLTENGGVKVLQGRCLGGGTAVNWSACLPPRPETLDEWQKRGLPFTPQNLEPYLREVVNYLPIVANDKYNSSAQKFMQGCQHPNVNILAENLPNNTHKCRECGSCGVGCPYDRKMSGFVKWLPDAVALGAKIYTDTKVDRLVASGDRIREVQAYFIDGKTRPTKRKLVVKPTKGVLLAAGAIGTPGILLRSKLEVKRVGKYTHIHPVTITIGKYPEKTYPAYGVPDNMLTRKFESGPTGYLIETGSFFPVLTASATLQHGAELHRIMRDYYPTGAISYAHHTTGFNDKEEYGTVSLHKGYPQLDYKIPAANVKPMQESLEIMTRIHLAAGAKSVYIMRNPPLEVKPGDNFDEIRKIDFTEPQRATIFTVHVMGGCQMHKDDQRRCVNNDFTFRGKKNLWVVDASIFPTALGANPQVTIYSLALWAAREICEQYQKPFKLNHQQGGALPWPDYEKN